jgi:hypothetical protein
VFNEVDVNDLTTLVAHMVCVARAMLREVIQQEAIVLSCKCLLKVRQTGMCVSHSPPDC